MDAWVGYVIWYATQRSQTPLKVLRKKGGGLSPPYVMRRGLGLDIWRRGVRCGQTWSVFLAETQNAAEVLCRRAAQVLSGEVRVRPCWVCTIECHGGQNGPAKSIGSEVSEGLATLDGFSCSYQTRTAGSVRQGRPVTPRSL